MCPAHLPSPNPHRRKSWRCSAQQGSSKSSLRCRRRRRWLATRRGGCAACPGPRRPWGRPRGGGTSRNSPSSGTRSPSSGSRRQVPSLTSRRRRSALIRRGMSCEVACLVLASLRISVNSYNRIRKQVSLAACWRAAQEEWWLYRGWAGMVSGIRGRLGMMEVSGRAGSGGQQRSARVSGARVVQACENGWYR